MDGMFHGASDFNQQMCWVIPVDEEYVFGGNECSPCIVCT